MGDTFKSELRRLLMIGLVGLLPLIAIIMWWQRRDVRQVHEIQHETPLVIAVLAPQDTAKGQAIAHAARLFAEQRNATGGVNGHRLVIEVVDDAGEPAAVVAAARRATDSAALAAVGHLTSTATITAGPTYEQAGLPVITPSATNDAVTKSSTVFSAIFNDTQQGQFLAAYAKHALGAKHAVIISEPGVYGDHLATVLTTACGALGMPLQGRFALSDAEAIVRAAAAFPPETIVFLAARSNEVAPVLGKLRVNFRGPVMGPDALASEDFARAVQSASADGKATDELYIAMPLIFDTAGARAQEFRRLYRERFQIEPLWHAAYTYDALEVLARGLTHTNATGAAPQRATERNQLLAYLRGLDRPDKAIDGLTGKNYFAPDRSSPKPLAIAVYHTTFVSALTQLRATSYREDLEREGQLFRVGSAWMTRTDVVYSGLRLQRVSSIDFRQQIASLSFDLWFRYRPPLDATAIEFINAVEPIALGQPVQEFEQGGQRYAAYRVSGKFRLNSAPGPTPTFEQSVVSAGFRHRKKTQSEIMYVADEAGLKHDPAQPLFDSSIVEASLEMSVLDSWIAQETTKRNVLGDPRYLFSEGPDIEQSTLYAAARLSPIQFTLRRRLNSRLADSLLLLGVVGVFFLYAAGRLTHRRPNVAKWLWGFEVLAWAAVLLLAEVFLLETVVPKSNRSYSEPVVLLFDVAWWCFGAIALVTGLDRIVWRPIEVRTNRPIPNVAKQFVSWMVWIITFFCIMAFAFDRKITGLLATSGLIAMIIGLAIQMNISNIFSGIVLNLERPFRIGDLVDINGKVGRVVDVSWRATKLQLGGGEVISIPNAVVAGTFITNYTFPNSTISVDMDLWVEPQHAPARVEGALQRAIAEVLPEFQGDVPMVVGEPRTAYLGVDTRGAKYRVEVKLLSYEFRGRVMKALHRVVWTHLDQDSITMLSQQTTVAVASKAAASSQPPAESGNKHDVQLEAS